MLQQFAKTQGKKISLKKNMMVFQAGDAPTHFYFLESGYIKIFQEAENGQAITLALFKAGQVFGLAELLAKQATRERYAAGLVDITFYSVTAEQLSTYLEQEPILWQSLSQLMAQRLIDTQNLVKTLTSLPVPQRLGWFLQQFATQKNDWEIIIELPLSHEEISFLINCSRQKVTSNLNRWRKEGYIAYERGKIEVLHPDKVFI